MTHDEVLAEIAASLDPALRERLFGGGGQPRYRYYETPDGCQFVYTVERANTGHSDAPWTSGVYRPQGYRKLTRIREAMKKGRVVRYHLTDESHHRLRRDGRDRALRLFKEHLRSLAERGIPEAVKQAERWRVEVAS